MLMGWIHDTSNPPYIILGDAMYANNLVKKQWSYMKLELKSSYHYLMGDLGNECLSCELSLFWLEPSLQLVS